jgi:hypothetical protein
VTRIHGHVEPIRIDFRDGTGCATPTAVLMFPHRSPGVLDEEASTARRCIHHCWFEHAPITDDDAPSCAVAGETHYAAISCGRP